MSNSIPPFQEYDCVPLWRILRDEENKRINEQIIADYKEHIYIERRLKDNGIDIDELEIEQ